MFSYDPSASTWMTCQSPLLRLRFTNKIHIYHDMHEELRREGWNKNWKQLWSNVLVLRLRTSNPLLLVSCDLFRNLYPIPADKAKTTQNTATPAPQTIIIAPTWGPKTTVLRLCALWQANCRPSKKQTRQEENTATRIPFSSLYVCFCYSRHNVSWLTS